MNYSSICYSSAALMAPKHDILKTPDKLAKESPYKIFNSCSKLEENQGKRRTRSVQRGGRGGRGAESKTFLGRSTVNTIKTDRKFLN